MCYSPITTILLNPAPSEEQAYRNKDSEAGDKEMVSESSDKEDDTETASRPQKTQIWNLKEL